MKILNGDARALTCDPMNDTDVWYIMRQVNQGTTVPVLVSLVPLEGRISGACKFVSYEEPYINPSDLNRFINQYLPRGGGMREDASESKEIRSKHTKQLAQGRRSRSD